MQQHVLDSWPRSEDEPPAVSLLWGVVDNSTTRRCIATENPCPAESAAVCAGELQSKGLGFGADCKRSVGFTHFSSTETYGPRGGD
jgi:hypothetical protein